MNYCKGLIAPLLLALIAIFLIGGGTYVYLQKNQGNQPVIGDVTLPEATSTAQASFSQTAGWKTYVNKTSRYEIKYPALNFKISVNPNGFSEADLNGRTIVDIYPIPSPQEFGSVLNITVFKVTNDISPDSWIKNYINSGHGYEIERNFVVINGIEWLHIKWVGEDPYEGAAVMVTYENYFALKNGYWYTINLSPWSTKILISNYKDIVATILLY